MAVRSSGVPVLHSRKLILKCENKVRGNQRDKLADILTCYNCAAFTKDNKSMRLIEKRLRHFLSTGILLLCVSVVAQPLHTTNSEPVHIIKGLSCPVCQLVGTSGKVSLETVGWEDSGADRKEHVKVVYGCTHGCRWTSVEVYPVPETSQLPPTSSTNRLGLGLPPRTA